MSDYAKLFKRFIEKYYEFSTSEALRTNGGRSEYECYDESKVKYDLLGNVVEEGEVLYIIRKPLGDKSIEFNTKFIMKPLGQKMDIVINKIEEKPDEEVKSFGTVGPVHTDKMVNNVQ